MSIRNELLERQVGTIDDSGRYNRSMAVMREDYKISSDGQLYNIDVLRSDIIPVGDPGNLFDASYFTIEATTKYVIIEGIATDVLETSEAASARIVHDLFFYFSNSNKNDFTAPTGTPITLTSLNSVHINDVATANVEGAVPATVNSGVYDLRPLHYDSIINSQGNSRTRADVASSFFSDGKIIVLHPGTKLLIESTVRSDAAVVVDLFSQVFVSEYDSLTSVAQ